MDFHSLINTAKQNVNTGVKKDKNNKYYSTSFAPPKKTLKEKKLSAGIQKFLEQQKLEDEAKAEEARRKKAALLAKRDDKEQRKIDKTLKTIKSSRKFHSGERDIDENMESQQPDEDDYGYVSTYSEQLHKKLMQQYNTMPEDKKFTSGSMGKSRISTKDDIQKLKDSLCSKEEEHHFRSGPSQRKTHSKSLDKPSTLSGSMNSSFDKKPTPTEKKPKPKHRPAPIVDFQALLKLAEQKQHEEIEVEVPTTKKKEERPMTSKEKRELEEVEAARRARIQRVKMAKISDKNNNNGTKIRIDKKPLTKSDDDLKRLKLAEKMKPPSNIGKTDKNSNSFAKPNPSQMPSKLRESLTKPMKRPLEPSSSKAKLNSSSNASMKSRENHKPQNGCGSQKPSPSAIKTKPSSSSQITNNSKVPEKTREFPPKDLQSKSREFPPKDLMRAREFPPKDLMRSREFPPKDLKPLNRGKPSLNLKKRRIEDEDSEYDSEMDDFIDDGDADVDISQEIRNIFGYDKTRYRHEVYDDDDDMMESDFRTQMREEAMSKKIGRLEDLEDMRREEEELKRKAQMKKNKKKMR